MTAFSRERSQTLNRRGFGAFAAASVFAVPYVAVAESIIETPICIDGVGEGCDALAGGNPLIQRLQKSSAANKEKYEKEMLQQYNEVRRAFAIFDSRSSDINYTRWLARVLKAVVASRTSRRMVVRAGPTADFAPYLRGSARRR
ncbi:unnamed protein product [Phaeothamnion confervicola]